MNSKKPRIFISYSHRGNGPKWNEWLVRHLHVFKQHHLLDVWQDGKIRVSSFWDDDIKEAMSSARLAVVLLTKEALESEYILNTEFPFLRERQQRDRLPVFPVVCEECNWRAHDWLRATQAPNESNPLSQLSEKGQDRAFRKLATDIAEEMSRAALAELPKPEQPPLADRSYLDNFSLTYGGGRPVKLFGREQELALLDLALTQSDTAIVSLVAWGGVGKTMLVQHWLQRLQRAGLLAAQRVFAWSFYSQGTKENRQASEDTFLAHALAWFGLQCEPTLSPWEKGRRLADAVDGESTLLILDGIEPLQYPPGPIGGRLRAPGVQSLMKRLARQANYTKYRGLCLVTTREPLADLADFERHPDAAWGSLLRVDLGNLPEEAGAALLHHTGAKRAGAAEIKAVDEELMSASREVDGHPLTLFLLGRFLARAHSGDIRRRDLVRFEEADRNVQGGTTFKMLAAFENWFKIGGGFYQQALSILRMLSLFDRPAEAGCIAALRNHPPIVGLTDPLFTLRVEASTKKTIIEPLANEYWNTAASFLADFGLLTIQPDADNKRIFLDCHPLIREHFAQQLREQTPEAWRSSHRVLYDHLRSSVDYRPDTLEGLQPLYQAIIHGCHAGLHEQVLFSIYLDRIIRDTDSFFSVKTLGAFSDDLSVLACFFEKPWNRVLPTLPVNAQMSVIGTAAFHLQALGRLIEAVEPMRASAILFEKHGPSRQAAIAMNNLADLELMLGDLAAAVRDGEHAASIARNLSPQSHIMLRTRYARVLHEAGRTAEALDEFWRCEQEYASYSPFGLLFSLQGFYYCDCLLAGLEKAAWRMQMVKRKFSAADSLEDEELASLLEIAVRIEQRTRKTLGVAERGGQPLDIALNLLALGRVALFKNILKHRGLYTCDQKVHPFCARALNALHTAGQQDEIPRVLLFRSWLLLRAGDTSGSQADLDEAWDIAERGPMRLHLADIHLHRARLFFFEKTYPWTSPEDDLAAAEKLIDECGYHRRDGELADAKCVILGEETPAK
jgi:tetratricopeptide (TPR) repeat protein